MEENPTGDLELAIKIAARLVSSEATYDTLVVGRMGKFTY